MKKITLFMSVADIDTDLTLLGQLGVMHMKPFQPAEDASIDRIEARIEQLNSAISILDTYNSETPDNKEKLNKADSFDNVRDEISLMELVLKTEEKKLYNKGLLKKLHAAKDWHSKWGNVSIKDIENLEKNGIFVKLYLLKDDELKKVISRKDIVLIGKQDQKNRVVLISEDKNDKLDYDEIKVPIYHQDTIDEYIEQISREVSEADSLLESLSEEAPLLINALEERNRRYQIRNVQFGGRDVEQQFRYWNGYVPEKSVDSVIETAEKRNWGYLIEDPTQDEIDEVPTLIRSPKWAESIKPVMNFMGLVPGYNEIDVSRVFMLFFTFFTGILVGDAGYGLVFLLITLFAHSKQKFKAKIEFTLIYTLSISVMFWGAITGTYFGVSQIAQIPFISQLVIEKMSSFAGDDIYIQKFMFIVGAIHLSIGHIQTGIKYINSTKAIAQLGWVAIVWGLFFVVNQMVLGQEAPSFMLWLFVGGALLIALFSNPGTSFFKGVLSSIGDLPLSLISGFSDIISYIRLYAVGLATVLMAVSFNEMAIGEGITTIASGIGAVIVLILGHGLNMILAAMAVIVHGVRLNMLEYAGHASVEFSGNEYNPFKINKVNNK